MADDAFRKDLEAIKRRPLDTIAARWRYVRDTRASTPLNPVLRAPGLPKIVLTLQDNGHWTSFNIQDADDNGTAIDFMRNRGLTVAAITHPSSRLSDFYREIGDLFGVNLLYNNRWATFKNLRERWLAHLDETRMRPVVLIDEAQDMLTSMFSEIRLLASTDFDSRAILSVVFAGDSRLIDRLRHVDLLPIASRIRQRLVLTRLEEDDLARLLDHLLDEAGNGALMTAALKTTLVQHAAGNPRAMTVMGDLLLAAAIEKERCVLDEHLFIDIAGAPPTARRTRR